MTTGPVSVILVHVPNMVWANGGYQTAQTEISLMAMGMFAIADAAERDGISVQLINLHSSLSADPAFDLVDHVVRARPRVLGFSVHWAKQLESSLKFAERIVERLPETRVVLGGFSASYFADEILEGFHGVHAVVRGDGEVPLRQYARQVLEGSEDFSRVANLVWRRGSEIVHNARPYTASPRDIEELDFARLDLLLHAEHYAPTYWTIRPEIAAQKAFIVSTGRGCSFNCSFCGGAAAAQKVINNRTRFMFRSPPSVMRTIETAVDHGYTNLYFDYDPAPDGPYYLELFELLRQRGLSGLTCCFGSWKLPTPELIESMRRTFQYGLFQISPETWSEESRRRNKDLRIHYSNHELEQSIQDVGRAGLYSQVYFGYIMPYDTKPAVYGTLGYVEYLNERYGATCEARFLRFSTDPGSPAFQRPEKFNVKLYAGTLREYLDMMAEANRRGYLNNMQLFQVNAMSLLDNFLASQMPPCFYQVQRDYPATTRLLISRLGFEGFLARLENGLLMPRWRGVLDPHQHTFDADPGVVYAFMQEVARTVPLPVLPAVLAQEYQMSTGRAPVAVPSDSLNSFA